MSSSEERVGIAEPPDYQCDGITEMVEHVKQAIRYTEQAVFALDKQTVIQANKETNLRLIEIPERLEDFRTAIEDARRWGNDWKAVAKTLLEKYEPERLRERPPVRYDDGLPF